MVSYLKFCFSFVPLVEYTFFFFKNALEFLKLF